MQGQSMRRVHVAVAWSGAAVPIAAGGDSGGSARSAVSGHDALVCNLPGDCWPGGKPGMPADPNVR